MQGTVYVANQLGIRGFLNGGTGAILGHVSAILNSAVTMANPTNAPCTAWINISSYPVATSFLDRLVRDVPSLTSSNVSNASQLHAGPKYNTC